MKRARAIAVLLFLVFGWLAHGVPAAPFLAISNSPAGAVVTWTNHPEIYLEESTDAVHWMRTSRPYDYIAAWKRVRATTAQTGFYQLIGASGTAPELQTQWDAGRLYARWRYPTAGFQLQSRARLGTGAWTNVAETPEVWSGYKWLVLSNSPSVLFFRLSRPLNHVLIVGQSLGIGYGGLPALSTEQPFQNKMFIGQSFDSGSPYYPLTPDDLSDLAPLVEQQVTNLSCGETIASSFANTITTWAGVGTHDLLVSNAGRAGAAYDNLKRGTAPYTRSTNQIAAAKTLCQGLGYNFSAVFAVHGEADFPTLNYQSDIHDWQRDYEADVTLLTGQTGTVPMFHSQPSSWGYNAYSPFAMLAEHELNPDRCVLVAPHYFLPHIDNFHLSNVSYRWLGEYYAKAYYRQVVLGRPWSPLRPISVKRTNHVITVTFTGVEGSLVMDTNLVRDPRGRMAYPVAGEFGPWTVPVSVAVTQNALRLPAHTLQPGDPVAFSPGSAPGGLDSSALYYVSAVPDNTSIRLSAVIGGPSLPLSAAPTNGSMFVQGAQQIGPYGFEYFDQEGGGLPWRCATEISSVDIIATNQVRITLSKAPTGVNQRLRYAYLGHASGTNGPASGPRGCLRDNDATASRYGNTLYNWCVHFDKAVE